MFMGIFPILPSGYVKIAIENHHSQWISPWKIVIFHSYVSLPEGKLQDGAPPIMFAGL